MEDLGLRDLGSKDFGCKIRVASYQDFFGVVSWDCSLTCAKER